MQIKKDQSTVASNALLPHIYTHHRQEKIKQYYSHIDGMQQHATSEQCMQWTKHRLKLMIVSIHWYTGSSVNGT